MKRFAFVVLALILLLSSFSILSFAEPEIYCVDFYEGVTARDDNLQGYIRHLHCASACMPYYSMIVTAFENGEKKLEAVVRVHDDDNDGVATFAVKSIPFNGMDKNTENTSYTYAFIDRSKDYTLVFQLAVSDFPVNAAFTFNGSADKVSIARDEDYVTVTVGPMKIASKVCTCNCHYNPWQAKNPSEFFKGLWGMIQLKIWQLLKRPEHQICECGTYHYAI